MSPAGYLAAPHRYPPQLALRLSGRVGGPSYQCIYSMEFSSFGTTEDLRYPVVLNPRKGIMRAA